MYTQNVDPLGNAGLSAIAALIPLGLLLVLLATKGRAHWAALAATAVAILEALFLNKMPAGQIGNAVLFGVANAIFLGIWIVLNPIWIYRLTVKSGHFEVLRRSFSRLSGSDTRVQALVIAFSFGTLIEALGGGGSPAAVASVMLISLGFQPLKAAAIALVADTAPVAFGALGGPVLVLGQVTGIAPGQLAAIIGRQTPVLGLLIPFILLVMVDGRRGLREAWPCALASALSFALVQFAFSNYLSFKLADVIAAIVSAVVTVQVARLHGGRREPTVVTADAPPTGGTGTAVRVRPDIDRRSEVVKAYAPYAIIVAVFSVAQIGPVPKLLGKATAVFPWPGLHIMEPGGVPFGTTFTLNLLTSSGTLLFIAAVLTAVVLRIRPGRTIAAYGETLHQFRYAALTICLLFALAYVMNLSGQTVSLALALASVGTFFAFLSPVAGWLGVLLTGSDAGSNTLFGYLQTVTARHVGLQPAVLAAANSSGGVLAKMVAPQSLTIAAASVGVAGGERMLFRRLLLLSLVLLIFLCLLVGLQSTPVLGWMV